MPQKGCLSQWQGGGEVYKGGVWGRGFSPVLRYEATVSFLFRPPKGMLAKVPVGVGVPPFFWNGVPDPSSSQTSPSLPQARGGSSSLRLVSILLHQMDGARGSASLRYPKNGWDLFSELSSFFLASEEFIFFIIKRFFI